MYRLIYLISRFLLVFLFIFSGAVKCFDPMGSAIKFEEYFHAFSLEFLVPASVFFAILLSSIELMIGMALLCGIYKRIFSLATLFFMSFFTILTIIIYFTDPVSDCGCFGDALILTNGETLLKNCIFILLSIFLYVLSRKEDIFPKYNFSTFIMVAIFSFGISTYSYFYLPVIDFLPYKSGTDIPNLINESRGAVGESETILLYRNVKTGKQQEFLLDDTEWQDTTTWEFVDAISQTETHKTIVSFDLLNSSGVDESSELFIIDTTLIIAAKDINTLTEYKDCFAKLSEYTLHKDFPLVVVTSSNIDLSYDLMSQYVDIRYIKVYNMDETLIKSLVRAPAGVVVMDRGVIIAKWNLKTMPKFDNAKEFNHYIKNHENRALFFRIIVIFAFMLMVINAFLQTRHIK